MKLARNFVDSSSAGSGAVAAAGQQAIRVREVLAGVLLYTARSQHAEIENSHSQRGKSEQAYRASGGWLKKLL